MQSNNGAWRQRLRDWRERVGERFGEGIWPRALAAGALAYLLISLILSIYWSMTPDGFGAQPNAAAVAEVRADQIMQGSRRRIDS